MSVRQYYYTSYVHKKAGSAGFQIKAMSPNISLDLQAILARLIAYRIPPTCDPRTLALHPISLRFYYEKTGECVLLCSQSCGNDEYGRPGNFFAHVLILEPDLFTSIPPIFFWKSPFWQTSDQEERDDIVSLPVLPSFAEKSALDVEAVWSFITQNDHCKLLYKLLCAVIHSVKDQRRIVILDTSEHVAMWIAAISCLLPPAYRPLLTFATYHHDVYQNYYLITGTTRDFFFASHEDHLSFFILDAEAGLTGPVDSSLYAELAIEAVRDNCYEAMLLPLFSDYAWRFPTPTIIDEQLDHLALYAIMQRSLDHNTLTLAALDVIRIVLPSFEKTQTNLPFQEDTHELTHIEAALRRTMRVSFTSVLQNEYQHVLVLLRMREVSIAQLVLEELVYFTRHLLLRSPETVAHFAVHDLCLVYGEECVIDTINSATYLDWLVEGIRATTLPQLVSIWEYLGSSLRPGSLSEGVLFSSLSRATYFFHQQHIDQLHPLLHIMAQAMREQPLAWLRLVVECYGNLPIALLSHLYRMMIPSLPLKQRIPYRAIVFPIYKDVLIDEVRNDICSVSSAQRITVIEQWLEHARCYGYQSTAILQAGLEQLFQGCSDEDVSTQEWQILAMQILKNEHLTPLPAAIEQRLVLLAFASLSLLHFLPTELALCQRYRHYSILSEHASAVIESVIALTSGVITFEQAEQIRRVVAVLQSEEYIAILQSSLAAFFCHDISHEVHSYLIQALFPRSIELMLTDNFWQVYQGILVAMLQQPTIVHRAIDMLDFWFSTSADALSFGYPMQQFFSLLPMNEHFQRYWKAQASDDAFCGAAASQQWCPSINAALSMQKSTFASFPQYFLTQWQIHKHERNERKKKANSAKSRRTLEVEIDGLFTSEEVLGQHYLCAQLYGELSPTQFWHLYWKRFTTLLTSRDADRVLAILSFWFDHASKAPLSACYMQQEFFLGVSSVLEAATTLPGFRETARIVRTKGAQHRWYWQIAPYVRDER